MDWNIIGGICAIIGVLFLLYQFIYLPREESKNEKQALLAHFTSTKIVLDKLIDDIDEFAQANNYYYHNFNNASTFRKQLDHLISIRKEGLSDELYKKIANEPLTKEMISLMIKGLDEQVKSFHQVSAYFRSTF